MLPQAMAWVQYLFRVLSLKFCRKSKRICGDISQVSPAFCMYDLVYFWLSLFSLGGSFVPWITPPKTGSEKWNARKLVFSTVCSFGAEVFITKTLPLGMWDPLVGTFPGGRGQFSDFFVIFNYLVPCPTSQKWTFREATSCF